MRESNIHTYAQQLVHLMGPRAETFAAQKAENYRSGGEPHEADDWRRIRNAVVTIRANRGASPHHI